MLVYGRCDSCGETLQGKVDEQGDFIPDSEIGKPFPAVGCYLCGCPGISPTGEDGEWERVPE